MKMRQQWLMLLSIIIGITAFQSAWACDISIKFDDAKKNEFNRGDTVLITVKVNLPHRNCPNSIEQTEFAYDGIKVLGSTGWKDMKQQTWQKRFKVIVLDTLVEKVYFKAYRLCSAGGDEEILPIPVKAKD